MKNFTRVSFKGWLSLLAVAGLVAVGSESNFLESSSHREAPMIANDPQADNTDVYAFRNPKDPNSMVIIANYIPFQLPQGGPNYYFFGEEVAYDIHIKNNPKTKGDDIIYRFTFNNVNEDPTTFFKIRLGKENLKGRYNLTKSTDGGKSFSAVITNGVVPPYPVGPRSIESAVGLNSNYQAEFRKGITKASSGETVFVGPVDDPFFADLGAIFDLANIRPNNAVDGLRCLNVHTITMNIPISLLQKDGKGPEKAANILDSDFVIGVWASASRPKITVREANGAQKHQGPLVQVSRLGMPLTNEVIIPIGRKDEWNHTTPYDEKNFEKYFINPELGLYLDDSQFGEAVPGLSQLRIQTNSLQAFDFRNGKDGLFPLLGAPAAKGTALDPALFGNYLLRKGAPRSVDILPIFMTGVPNLAPYQLATGKDGNPLAQGKPFINNFLPTFGDMLRVNMAVPVTPRNSPDFSSEGLVQAAVLGLTDPRFNQSTKLEFIPNMDGFPNGRRLEDDVTRIELQAVGGVVLAAIGLFYDDYTAGSPNPVTQDLIDVLTFTTGVESNDKPFMNEFPFIAQPWNGFEDGAMCDCGETGGGEGKNPDRPSTPTFTLIDADTDQDLQTLREGDAIDLSKLSTTKLTIRLNLSETVGSVVFHLDGNPRYIENNAPYALFGNKGNDYNPGTLLPGPHRLKATTYTNTYGKGTAGLTHTLNFTVVGSRIESFTLVNADTDQDVGELREGDVIDYGMLGTRNINVRANTFPDSVGSVVFTLNGKLVRQENILPYALGGDNFPKVNDYLAYPLPLGNHTLKATAYSGRKGSGSVVAASSVSFSVATTGSASAAATALGGDGTGFVASPNPFTDHITLQLEPIGEPVQVSLVDQLGRRVYQKEFASLAGAMELDLSGANLNAGVYFLRLTAASTGTRVLKLIKTEKAKLKP
jgi:hypothetical protein